MARIPLRTWGLAVVLVGVFAVAYLWHVSSQRPNEELQGDRDVRLQAQAGNPRWTDITLIGADGTERAFISVQDVYREHAHPAAFVDGSLYIIRRMGDGASDLSWTDELWTYDARGEGRKVVAGRGLDFRVVAGRKLVAVLAPAEPGTEVKTLGTDGRIQETFDAARLGVTSDDSVNLLDAQDGHVWLSVNQGLLLKGLIDLDLSAEAMNATKHDLSALGIVGSEFSLQPQTGRIVYSDFKTNLEADQPERETKLYAYGLRTKETALLHALTTRLPLEPAWRDADTVEYLDSATGKRTTLDVAN